MNNLPFGSRLKEMLETGGLRHDHAISQAQLSKELKITRQAISSYLNSDTLPTIDKLRALAEYFGVTSDYLIGLSDAKQPENSSIVNQLGFSEQTVTAICAEKALSDIISKKRVNKVTPLELLDAYIYELCSSHEINKIAGLCNLMEKYAGSTVQQEIEAPDFASNETDQRVLTIERIAALDKEARTLGFHMVNHREFINHMLYKSENRWNTVFWQVLRHYTHDFMNDFFGDPNGND